MKAILIIDDDVYIGDMLAEALGQEGYAVMRAYSGTEALLVLDSKRPDLVLLDLMLPGLSGEEILPKIKDIPVIVLSAKADASSKVNLLLGGAQDYVTKPFDLNELLQFDGIVMNTETHSTEVCGQAVKLTRTEYAILKLLMQKPSQVFTKSRLLDRISEDTPDCTDSSLKIHISNLRRKLREPSGKDYIEAVWGIGFKLRNMTESLPKP